MVVDDASESGSMGRDLCLPFSTLPKRPRRPARDAEVIVGGQMSRMATKAEILAVSENGLEAVTERDLLLAQRKILLIDRHIRLSDPEELTEWREQV